jgi:ribonuclease HI
MDQNSIQDYNSLNNTNPLIENNPLNSNASNTFSQNNPLTSAPEISYSDLGKELKMQKATISELPSIGFTSKDSYQSPSVLHLRDYQRYLASDAAPSVGIDPNLSQKEMERQYDASQSYGEKFGNVVAKTWGKTESSFLGLFQADFTTHDTLIKQMYNELDKEKQYELFHPSFDTRSDEVKHSLLQWIPFTKGSGDNYEQFVPNLGYTLGTMGAVVAQNAIIGLATEGFGLIESAPLSILRAAKMFDIVNEFNTINKIKNTYNVIKNLNNIQKVVKGAKLGVEGYTMWSAFQAEGSMEAASTGQSTYDHLTDEYLKENGVLPIGDALQKIKDSAKSAAETDYWMNAPILLTSNFIQFGRAFFPTGSRFLREGVKDAMKGFKIEGDILRGAAALTPEKTFGEAWKAANTIGKVKVASELLTKSLAPMKNMLSEGMEESLQRFSSTLSQDYYVNKNIKGKGDLWESTKYSFNDMTSKEGLQEFIGGAIIGMGTSMVGKIADVTKISDKFAKLTGGETKAQEKERQAKYRTNIVDLVNKSGIDYMMKDQGFLDAFRDALISKDIIEYTKENNLFEVGIAKHIGLYRSVWNAMHSGKTDFIIDRYNAFGNESDIKWVADKLGISPDTINKDNLRQVTDSIVSKIKETKKNFKTVEDHFDNLGIEDSLINKHNALVKDSINYQNDLRLKYNISKDEPSLEKDWNTISAEDRLTYNQKLSDIEETKALIHGYKEAKVVAAISYQSVIDSKKAVEKLVGELNNNKAGLNYSESLALMDKNTLSNLTKQVKTSLSLATETEDKNKYQKQLDILNEAQELYKNDKQASPEKIGELMHKFVLTNKSNNDLVWDNPSLVTFEKLSNFKQKLQDIVRHQNRSKANLDIFNFLYNADNFEKFTEHNGDKIIEFLTNVTLWKFVIENEDLFKNNDAENNAPDTSATNTTTTTTAKTDDLVTVESDEITKEIEKKEGKNSPYNIEIVMDKDGKHFVKATYASLIYGRGDITMDEKNEIEAKYEDLIKSLDKKEKEDRVKKDTIEKIKKIVIKYEKKYEAFGTDISKADLEKLLADIDNEINSFLPSYKNTPEIVTFRKKILDELINLPEDYSFDGQQGNAYLPDDEVDESVFELFHSPTPYLSSIKTSSKDTEGISPDEVLKNDEYSSLVRKFILNINTISNLFFSETNPNGIYRLVLTNNTRDLQDKTYGKFQGEGVTILLQIKDGEGWKEAYVNPDTLAISDNSSDGRVLTFSFNDPESNAFPIIDAAEIRVDKGLESSFTEAMEFFSNENEINQKLRVRAIGGEDIPIQLSHISDGVVMNRTLVTPVRTALGSNLVENIQIAIGTKRDSKTNKLNTVIIGNKEFPAGTAIVQTKNGNYIPLRMNYLPEEKLKEIDMFMENEFYHEPGLPLSVEIKNMIAYLSTFVYTNKDKGFRFNPRNRRIEFFVRDKNNPNVTIPHASLSKYIGEGNKLYLNISQKQLQDTIGYTVKKENGKVKIAELADASTEKYIKFILDNASVRGSFDENGNIIYVSPYFTFSEVITDNLNTNPVPIELIQRQKELENKINDLIEKRKKIKEYQDAFSIEEYKERQRVIKEIDTKIGMTDLLNELNSVNEQIKSYKNPTAEVIITPVAPVSDIEGQVGTSNYSVINGLIFYNNADTTVANPKGEDVLKVIEADIERRRQEKLNKAKAKAEPNIKEWQKKADKNIETTGVISRPVSNTLDALQGSLFNELESINETFDKELLDNNIPNAKEIIDRRKEIASIENSRKNNLLYPGSETLEEINAYYNAKLARELYKEIKAGKMVTEMTVAEKAVADKYITPELRASVDAELAALEGKPTGTTEEEDKIFEELFEKYTKDPFSTFDFTEEERNIFNKEKYKSRFKVDDSIDLKADDFGEVLRMKKEDELLNTIYENISSEELQELEKVVGAAGMKILNRAANSKYWGRFTTAGVILTHGALKGTGYHEAWHVFSQMFLTKSEKRRLYNEVRSKNTKLKNASNKEIEEYLADDFMNFRIKGVSELLNMPPIRKNFFQKIWELLKNLFFGKVNIEKLYSDLRRGNFADYKNIGIKNAMFGTLNYAKGLEKLSYDRLNIYSRHMDAEIGRIVSEPLTSVSGKYEGTILSQNRAISIILENPVLIDIIKKELYNKFSNLGKNSADEFVKEEVDYILNNWESFINYNSKYSANSYDLVDDTKYEGEDENDENESSTKERVYDKRSDEERPSYAGKKIAKQLILLCPKCVWNKSQNTYNIVMDENGIIEPSNFENLWNNIIYVLNNTFDENDLFNKMRNKENQKKIPELGYIIDRLIPPSTNTSKSAIDLRHAFFLSFMNPIVPIRQSVRKEKTIGEKENTELVYNFFQKEETKNNQKTIERKALSRFQGFSDETQDPFIQQMINLGVIIKEDNKNFIGSKFTSVNAVLDFKKNEDKIKFLKLLGYEIPQIDFTSAKMVKEFNDLAEPLKKLSSNLASRVREGKKLENPINGLKNPTFTTDKYSDEIVKIEGERDSIRKVTNFISNYSLEDSSMSYNGPNGKLRYAPVKPNKITTLNHFLSNSTSLEDLISRNKFGFNFEYLNPDLYANVRGSYFFELMFGKKTNDNQNNYPRKTDINNEPLKILIESYIGYSKVNEKEAVLESNDSDELSDRDTLIVNISTLLSSGRLPMLQPASKKTTLSMTLTTYNPSVATPSILPVSLEKINSAKDPYMIPSFVNIIKSYVEAELFKIGSPKYQEATKRSNGKVIRDGFSLFSNVFTSKLEDGRTLEDVLKEEAIQVTDGNFMKVIENHEVEVLNAVSNWLKGKKQDLKNEITKFNIKEKEFSYDLRAKLSKDPNTPYFEKILDAFIINSYVLRVEEIKLFRNDPTLYKDMFKRIGQDVSDGILAIPSEELSNFLETTKFYNLSHGVNKNPTSAEDNTKLNFITIADQIEKESPIVTIVEKGNKLNFFNSNTPIPKIVSDAAYSYNMLYEKAMGIKYDNNNIEFINKIKSEFIEELDKKGNSKAGRYANVNITDGGAKITLDAYRKLRLFTNNWEDKHEYLFRAISLEYKMKNKLYSSTPNPIETKEKWKKEIETFYELAEDAVFNIMKFQINVTIVRDGVEEAILHKFSLSPLIPSAMEGKELENIHEDMLKKGVDYIPFESASKVSTVNIMNLLQLGLSNVNLDPSMKISIESSSAKEQILTENKVKGTVSAGVQMQQIGFQDLIINGKPIDFNGTVEEYEKTPDDQLTNIGMAYRIYNNAMDKLKAIYRKELLDMLGISIKNNNYEITDAKKIVEKLQELIVSKKGSINIADYIAYDPQTKGLANPLDFSMSSDDIKKMINGLIDSKTRKLRLYGSSFIQDSDFGQKSKNHSFTNPTQEQLLEYGVNGLPFYYLKKVNDNLTISKMGCKISLTGDYLNLLNKTHLDGEKISTRERLNECIANKKWRETNEEALTIVGYRTPTQGKNAMDIMVIHEFLPEICGNTIILPAGITTKSGTDYDIDKMSLYFKHLSYQGDVIKPVDDATRRDLNNRLVEIEKYLVLNYDDLVNSKKVKKEILKSIKLNKDKINELISETDVSEDEEDEIIDFEKQKQKEDIKKEIQSLKKELRRSTNPTIKRYYDFLTEGKAIKKTLNEKIQAQNQIVKAFEIALSSPLSFYSLTKPNSSSSLEELSKIIGEKTGRETKIFSNSDVVPYLASWNTRNQLIESKAALSGWATNITFSQNLIASDMHISNTLRIKKNGQPIVINNPLISIAEEQEVMPFKNSYDLSGLFMLDNYTLISSAFVEASTMTVDAENNPFARTLGLNKWNNWVAIYLTLKRVMPKNQWLFLNQPILLEFYSRLNSEGFNNKNKIIAKITKEYFSDLFPKNININTEDSRKIKSFIVYLQSIKIDKFNPNTLLNALDKNTYGNIKDISSKGDKWKLLQFHAFLYFIQAEQEAKILQKLRKNTNFPSRKLTSILEIEDIDNTKRFLYESPFFLNVDKYYKKSLSLKYDERNLFRAVYSTLFPISSNEKVSSLFIKNNNNFLDEEEKNPLAPRKNAWSEVSRIKAEKILTNDVMFGIIQNFGVPFGNIVANTVLDTGDAILIENKDGVHLILDRLDDGYNVINKQGEEFKVDFDKVTALETFKLADDTKNRLRAGKGGKPLGKRIMELKEKYPNLENQFPVIKRFSINTDNKNTNYANIEFFRQDANQKPDKDAYITQLKALTTHDNFEISGLFSELMPVAFYQSGYNMSPLYFTDLLNFNPSLMRMIHQANNLFLRLQKQDPEFLEGFLQKLGEKVRLNNPNYYYYKSMDGSIVEKVNFKYHRGKDYSINMNDLAFEYFNRVSVGNVSKNEKLNITEETSKLIETNKKTAVITEGTFTGEVYDLYNGEEVKLNLLNIITYIKEGDEEYLTMDGELISNNIKSEYDKTQDISIIDNESFAKAMGFESFNDIKEKSSMFQKLMNGYSLNLYEIIKIKTHKKEVDLVPKTNPIIPAVVTPTQPSTSVNERIKKEYPKTINVNGIVLDTNKLLEFNSFEEITEEKALDEEVIKKYGNVAESISEYLYLSKKRAEWIKNNSEFSKNLLNAFLNDESVDFYLNEFVTDLLDKNVKLIDTYQLNLFNDYKVEDKQTPIIVKTISTKEKPLQIYSDGSHIKGTSQIGFGSVYMYNGKEYFLTGTEESDDVKELQRMFPDATFSNPTMEMLALAKTLEAFGNTGENIVINQDYKGAVNYNELWNYSKGSQERATKPWKSKEEYIKYLVERATQAIKQIEKNGGSVQLNWVKGHTGNKMNDLADKYAKDRRNENTLTSPLISVQTTKNPLSSQSVSILDELDEAASFSSNEEFSTEDVSDSSNGQTIPFNEDNDMPYSPPYTQDEIDRLTKIDDNIDHTDFQC